MPLLRDLLTLVRRFEAKLGGGAIGARLSRGGAAALAVNIAGLAIGFLLQLLLVRAIGVESYGRFAYALACLNVLGLIALCGHDILLLREIAAWRPQGEWALLSGVRRHAYSVVALISLVLAVAGSLFLAAYEGPSSEFRWTFLVAMAALPILAMLRLTATQVLAGGAPALSAAPERIGRDGLALALLGAAAAIGVSLTAVEAMALLAAGLVLALMAALLARSKVFAGDPRPATALYRRREWIGAAAAFAALGGLQMLVHRLDVILLGWLAGTTAAGLYWIAVAISEIATLPMLALGSVAVPAIAALYARDDLAAKRATMRSATIRMVVGTCLFAAPLFVLAPWLLGAFGARFIEATDALRILLLGQFLRALAGPVLAMLALTGNERVATAILAAAAICDAILCVVLIPRYGLTGAAMASLAVWAGSHLVMTVLVWRRFGYVPLFASHAP